jgi:predicted SAM-dependent methyltransferase
LPLPFKNNTFDYVYCSHVLEDFIDPIPLMEEMIRITKTGGKIEIRVPNETYGWSSLHHKRCFNVQALKDFVKSEHYGIKRRTVQVTDLKYYSEGSWYFKICVFFANLLGNEIIDYTFMKCLFPMLYIKVVYTKVGLI